MTGPGPATAYVGVYDAKGTLLGEVSYVVGKALHLRHCSLCDITHSPLRRKAAWDAMVTRLGVPFELLHRDEMPADVAAAVAATGLPVVLARLGDGGLSPVIGPADLGPMQGSVEALEAALWSARP
ncbi:MAG TPA: hypothetical protein VES95_09050 [Dermatophilaceae bacterium]|nr:hypothetical protein [Dermatophilaceae bacterium]